MWQERSSERIAEHIAVIAAPQIWRRQFKISLKSAYLSTQESCLSTILDGRQVVKVNLEESKNIPQERISQRIREQTIDGLASRVMTGVVEVTTLLLQQSIQQRTVEKIAVQIREQIVQVGKVIPQERPSWRGHFFRIAVRGALSSLFTGTCL